VKLIEKAGTWVIKVGFPSMEEIIPLGGWDWELGDGKTGSMLSEFEVVRTGFYHSLRTSGDSRKTRVKSARWKMWLLAISSTPLRREALRL
jgi:hypothetical protein